mgnify:CR=1 FL=1
MYIALGIDNGVGVGLVENGEIIATVGSGHTIEEVTNREAWATNSDRIGDRVKSSELAQVCSTGDKYTISFVESGYVKRVNGDTSVEEIIPDYNTLA